jgi:TolB-like protein
MKTKSENNRGTVSRKNFRVFAVLSLVLALTLVSFIGCSKRYHNLPAFSAFPIPDPANESVGRFKTSYLADQIHSYFRGNVAGPIAVTTFVNIDDLYQSSTFGRILAEQLISELAMRGYNVIEVRQSDSMQITVNGGEFSLSRETATLRDKRDLSAIVVGTYAVSPVRVYINARIIDPVNSLVVSVGSVEMSKSDEIDRLLRANSVPTSLERIPVRHLGYSVYPAPYYYPSYGYALPSPNPMGPSMGYELGEWHAPGKNEQDTARIVPELPQANAKKTGPGSGS